MDDETIKTVTNLPVAVPYASRDALPNHLPPTPSNFKTVAVVPCLVIITHEPQEGYVDGSYPELECFKMQTEILPETTENLAIGQKSVSCITNTNSSHDMIVQTRMIARCNKFLYLELNHRK